jgi:hypothetical protein
VLGKVGVLLDGVLIVGVDLLVFYLLEFLDLLDLLVFYLLAWTWAGCAGQGWCSTCWCSTCWNCYTCWTCWCSTCFCGRGLAVLGKVGVLLDGVDLLVFYLLDLLDLLDLLVSYLLVWTWAGCAGRGCFR